MGEIMGDSTRELRAKIEAVVSLLPTYCIGFVALLAEIHNYNNQQPTLRINKV